MSTFDDEDRKFLREQWVPDLKMLLQRRQETRDRIMKGASILFIVIAALLMRKGIDGFTLLSAIALLISLATAICNLYLQMHNCDDIVVLVAGKVSVGTKEEAMEAMDHLSCLGNAGNILLRDIKPILKGIQILDKPKKH